VTRHLLDTNIVSEGFRSEPRPAIAEWVQRQPGHDLYISTLTIAEIWRGILLLARGRRRRALETWFTGPEGPQALFTGRILPFDGAAALEWGRIMAQGAAAGRPRSPLDMIIAATAAAHDCVVVTANQRDFEGVVAFFNPLQPRR
jgi:toxin FitB